MKIPSELLDTIAQRYGISASQLKPVSGGHFSLVYEAELDGRCSILRITPPNADIDLQAMRAILEWLAFASRQGAPVSAPIASRAGNLIEMIDTSGRQWISTFFEKAPGVLAEGMSPAEWSSDLFQELGRAVARCHLAAQEYTPPFEELRRPNWQATTNCFNPLQELLQADPAILACRAAVLENLRVLPVYPASFGLAHLDLHFGNFFVDVEHQRITLFDFDDCAYGWYLMDIAMLVFDIVVVYKGTDSLQFAERFLENLLRGYISQKPLTAFWMRQLPHFLKLLEIGVYIMLAPTYDPARADEWVSKFMPCRQQSIEEDFPYAELDFEAILRQASSS